ncbi:MAG: hypothetical protein IPN94_18055 [Sphingobacteriales bacterium]|nr:hypothetical protein [Sphingobacteriales bacterium]
MFYLYPYLITVTITATFTTTPTTWSVKSSFAVKQQRFAYSLTLDDGLKDTYTTAFKLLNGGTINETGQTFIIHSLKYTDV